MRLLISCCLFILLPNILFAEPLVTGKLAPNFQVKDSAGNNVHLREYRGQVVVLEWFNHSCPFVKKHYDSKNMQALQKKYMEQGVVWLAISSSNPSRSAYVNGPEAEKQMQERGASLSAIIIDADGYLGSLYSAKTTPHMYVIDREGVLQYQGAIDDIPSTDVDDVESANNFVSAALDAVIAGEKVKIGTTRAYGCSIKY